MLRANEMLVRLKSSLCSNNFPLVNVKGEIFYCFRNSSEMNDTNQSK